MTIMGETDKSKKLLVEKLVGDNHLENKEQLLTFRYSKTVSISSTIHISVTYSVAYPGIFSGGFSKFI